MPQGAPTSPIISNLICRGLDRDLERLARNHQCVYTRYADDITFSTNRSNFSEAIVASAPTLENPAPTLGSDLLAVLNKHSLVLNPKKCRVRSKRDRQEVTGIIVNEKINVPRSFVRNIRSILRDCEVNGVFKATQKFRRVDKKARLGAPPGVMLHLRGKLDYLKMVRGPDDPIYVRLALRAEKVEQSRFYGVPIIGRSAELNQFLREAIWIVLGIDQNDLEVSQGTGFTLDGIGIVSAQHVFENGIKEKACRWELINAANPLVRYAITGFRAKPGLDLAVIECSAPTVAALSPDTEQPQSADRLRIVGFPVWNTIADQLFVAPTALFQMKIANGLRYLLTGGPVRNGNSGGPILGNDGLVVGVALFDDTSPIAPDGGLSITHVDTVATAPVRPLP